MPHLKLLFITTDRSRHVERSTHYLIEELKKKVRLMIWSEHGHLPTILSMLPMKPDFILCNDFKPEYCPFITGIRETEVPVGILMHDLHYKTKKRKSFIEKGNIRAIFSHYRDAFLETFPEYKKQFIWFPHHVPVDLFKDYGEPKSTNWLFIGASFPHLYPLRAKIINVMNGKPGFKKHDHPGYSPVKRATEHVYTGETYAREINRAKMLFTCQSYYRLPVLKYFEAAACNTLVLGDGSRELTDLGFIDGKTYVDIREDNIWEKASYYLHHEDERMDIAANSYDMVRSRHSTAQRTNELIMHMKRIIKREKIGE